MLSVPDHTPPPEAAPVATIELPLRRLGPGDPFRWLAAGWRDFRRCPWIGLFYGGSFAAMGGLLMLVFRGAPAYTLALSAGFLLVGPFLCMGLYQASAALERGERPTLVASLTAWRARAGTLGIFGFVLLVLELLWGRASLVVFALSFDGMPDFRGSLLALLAPDNLGFIVAYLAVGGAFASLIYAISVIAIPMILDRHVDAISAALLSLRLVLTQPLVMGLWAALIALIVFVAMLPFFLGLLVAAPVLGHASWHAYRMALDAA